MAPTSPDGPLGPELSEAERRFEYWRRKSGLWLAPALFLIVWLLPLDLPAEQHRLVSVLALIVVLWVTEALPLALTGLLAPVMMVLTGVVPVAKAFAPFADPIMFLFIGAFVLAKGIQLHGLDRRFAYAVLTHPFVGNRPSRILFAYGLVSLLISMWISNTATVAMLFPIGLAIIRMLKHVDPSILSTRYPSGLMLMTAFAAAIGGLATPVGTPTNLIGLGFVRRQLGVDIAFFDWMLFAVPIVIVLFMGLYVYLNTLCRTGTKEIAGMDRLLRSERSALGPLSIAERNTMLAFGVAVALWVLPGFLAIGYGNDHPVTQAVSRHIPESIAALIGAVLLFFLPVDRARGSFTLTVGQALDIDWGILAMYGGGIALGQTVFDLGLAGSIAGMLGPVVPSEGVGLTAVSAGIATLVSELTSNVSSANMVVPLVIALAGQGGLTAALAATLASSLGFMLPISTPTNAIVYSSGYIPLGRMVRYGLLLDLLGFLVILLGSLILIPTSSPL
ncbi:MAG: DASS family sodium-coupled anion symporter [Bacteroidetes bacterium]|jgi:sodium-dependent dicarboxylate transporter 2/3/5|nr:DASS family sodium-coupled anion symporter [Bacteroidota bacterium]